MLLSLVTFAMAASAAKLYPGQQSPRGAVESGGAQFLSSPNDDSRSPGFGAARSGSYNAPTAPIVEILAYNNQPDAGDGSYTYSFEGNNGIQAQETGSVAGPDAGTSVQGGFSYISPEGQAIRLSYAAGEGGFVPQGDHIPTPPPIPEEILKVIAQNAADEAAGIFDDGLYRGGVAPLSRGAPRAGG